MILADFLAKRSLDMIESLVYMMESFLVELATLVVSSLVLVLL